MNKCLVDLREILEDLSEVCFCPECGAVIGCYKHLCKRCKERVANPIDGGVFVEYFKEKYKEKLESTK